MNTPTLGEPLAGNLGTLRNTVETFAFTIEIPQYVAHTNLVTSHKALRAHLSNNGYTPVALSPMETAQDPTLQAALATAQTSLALAQQSLAPKVVIQGLESHIAALLVQLGAPPAKASVIDIVALDDMQLAQSKCEKWLLASSQEKLTLLRTCATQITALHDKIRDQRNAATNHFLALGADINLARQHLTKPPAAETAAAAASALAAATAAALTSNAKAAELGATLLAAKDGIWAGIAKSQPFLDAANGFVTAPTLEGLYALCVLVNNRSMTEVVNTVNLSAAPTAMTAPAPPPPALAPAPAPMPAIMPVPPPVPATPAALPAAQDMISPLITAASPTKDVMAPFALEEDFSMEDTEMSAAPFNDQANILDA